MQAILGLTSRSILLNSGRVHSDACSQVAAENYFALVNRFLTEGFADLTHAHRNGGDQKIRITQVTLTNGKSQLKGSFSPGDKINIILQFESQIHSEDFEIGYSVRTLAGTILFTCSSSDHGTLLKVHPGSYRIQTTIEPNYLRPGKYYLQLGITCGILRDLIPEAIFFEITNAGVMSQSPLFGLPGHLYFEYHWKDFRLEEPSKIEQINGLGRSEP